MTRAAVFYTCINVVPPVSVPTQPFRPAYQPFPPQRQSFPVSFSQPQISFSSCLAVFSTTPGSYGSLSPASPMIRL